MTGKIELLKSNPKLILSRLNRWMTGINRWFHRRFVSKSGIEIMPSDWDNLLILDACRYDEFVSASRLPGETEPKVSQASTSEEWYGENFGSDHYLDTVCVSANPFTVDFANQFHACELLQTSEYWNSEYRTVLPETVANRARAALNDYPNKRLIVHFMQPHFPPIGPSRKGLPTGGTHPDDEEIDKTYLGTRAYLRGRVNGVTEQKALKAYRENLQIVLDVVEELLTDLDGKTVITSDHGELFGERLYPIPVRGILHTGDLRIEELVTVPWHTAPFTQRREIIAEKQPEEIMSIEQSTIDSRLRALGYR